MTPFATFALLYMTALFLELGEKWTYPVFTSATLLLVILILLTGITRLKFLIFLAITTSHFVLVQFPDVANHVNLAIYCNLLLMAGIIHSLVRSRDFPTDDDCFAMLRPLLQVTTVIMYFMAGFHKLNSDFFDPAVSCVGGMVGSLAKVVNVAPPASSSALLAMGVVVIAWELIGGPLLAIPRFQLPLLAFSWAMHSSLSLIGFVDFGALALALLFTFVPQPYLGRLNASVRVPFLGLVMHRAHLYLAICILAGIASGLSRRLASGLLFSLAALVFLWPILVALAGRPRPAWTGVPITGRMTPRWMFIFPVLLILHGSTSYLGLRTAGNFSMFSNLRTEGPVSNHVLLGSNPLKLWNYQEDAVRFIEISDRRARIGYQYQPLKGNLLPVVEFRKLIYEWTEAGAKVPMTFDYRGRIHSTDDIANDPDWRVGARDWEMRLMDFRSIQPGGPNRCRW